ncbi:MAG: alkaline phosphatase D family protein, partial [Bacteroidota bacterium]
PDQLKFVVVSCNNYQSGYFNAFGRIAERNDIDAVIHLGDFIYEYETGGFGFDPEIGRTHDPDNEILTLEDYRIRYGFYRLDSDLRRAMQQHPFIHIWDDHEVANDAWRDGAQNHDPILEGDYQTRKSEATKAFFEWVPLTDNPDSLVYRSLNYGDLAKLVLLDTRHEERTLQVDSTTDPNINDPNRVLLGQQQLDWFKSELQTPDQQWKVVGNQVLFSHLLLDAFEPLFPGVSDGFLDIWQGYPSRRDTILEFLETEAIQDAVFVTGDIHVSMAFDVSKDPADPANYNPINGDGAVAVEFVTPSISSNNFDEAVGEAAAGLFEGVFPGANPHSEFIDFTEHGYFVLDVNPNRVQADYYFVPTVRNPDQTESFTCGVFSLSGDNFLQKTTTAAPPKPVQDIPAPDPTLLATSVENVRNLVWLSTFPNPVTETLTINYALNRTERVILELYDLSGRPLRQFTNHVQSPGNYQLDLELPFPKGRTAQKEWFKRYGALVNLWARICEREGVEVFAIASELNALLSTQTLESLPDKLEYFLDEDRQWNHLSRILKYRTLLEAEDLWEFGIERYPDQESYIRAKIRRQKAWADEVCHMKASDPIK